MFNEPGPYYYKLKYVTQFTAQIYKVAPYFLPINLTGPSSSSTFFTIDRCERYQLAIKLNNAKAIMHNFVKMKKVNIFLTQWWVGYEIFYAMNKYSSAYIPGSSFLAIVMLASSLFCILFISTRILIFKHWVFLYGRGFGFIFASVIIWRFMSPGIHFLSEFELWNICSNTIKETGNISGI